MEQAVWNKIASYSLFAFAGLKPQFARGYWAVHLRDMPILNSFGCPSYSFLCMKHQDQDNRVVHGLETSLINTVPFWLASSSYQVYKVEGEAQTVI